MRNPVLLNNKKFDVRIYMAVLSLDPLQIYVYPEGHTKTCMANYRLEKDVNEKYVHITNLTRNKDHPDIIYNTNPEIDDYGLPWSLTTILWHLGQAGADIELLWSRIYDMCVKTILTTADLNYQTIKENKLNRNSNISIFGMDVMIDSEMKPWLIEANGRPEMDPFSSPVHYTWHSNMGPDMLNLFGIEKVDRDSEYANEPREVTFEKELKYQSWDYKYEKVPEKLNNRITEWLKQHPD